MKVLELFAGSRSICKAASALGMQQFSTDITQFGDIDYVVDIMNFDPSKVPFVPDVLWASPPCTGFSVAAIGKNWYHDNTPKTDSARLGVQLVKKTIEIIEHYLALNPDLIYYVENPRGKLRKLGLLDFTPRHDTVTYCQYNDTPPPRMKPTDIWHNNLSWQPRPACKNGDPCHVAAPRGSSTGTQGLKGAYARSRVPDDLCREVLLA